MRFTIILTVLLCALAIGWMATAEEANPGVSSNKVLFNRDIRPILSEYCFACHGPDQNKRQGKLRLDQRDAALSRKAIIPGNSSKSLLIERIFTQDRDEIMPPPEAHKPLTDKQKELLKKWIDQGAEYQAHWSYVIPTRPQLPVVKDKRWIKNPIDNFILAALESKGIKPSQEADRATLVRRLSLDIIGLPASWDEVQTVLNSDDNWYEKTVDRLLASPHYGERMAVGWLDLVRFADTVGYHGDQNQRIFPYRDYVIKAFNANMPFDQFTREQLAGDLLPQPTVDQRVATGFNRLNMMTREGGAQPAEYLAKYAADRVRTVAGTWLGSTVGCAECHDHKYDPFTMKDFYSLAAYFGDLKQWGVYQDYDYTPNPDLKGWSNDHPFPPELEVESEYLKQRMNKLIEKMERIAKALHNSGNENQQGLSAKQLMFRWKDQLVKQNQSENKVGPTVTFGEKPAPRNSKSKQPGYTKAESKAANEEPAEKAEVQSDGSIQISGPIKQVPAITVPLDIGWLSAVRINLIPVEQASKNLSILRDNSASVTFKPVFYLKKLQEEKLIPLAIRFADTNLKEAIYRNSYDVVGIKDGWRTSAVNRHKLHKSIWWLDQPVEVSQGDSLLVKFPTNLLARIHISCEGEIPLSLNRDFILSETLQHLRSTGWDKAAFAEIKELEKQFHECRNGKAMTMVSEAVAKPLAMRVLPRGNFLDQSGPIVSPSPPGFLTNGNIGTSRLDLARWLTSAENPLTARVFVNRLWKQLFGNGLSNQLDDLGAQGEWPTHPELLDWLAVEFRESGWNIKHILKLMLMSSTYRQSAVTRLDCREMDPNNRLLSFQNPRRLEAEFIRDQALAVSGLLNKELGGPSVFPYQPAGYYSLLQFPDRNYLASKDDRQYRRGLYTHWQRMFLQPMMANFDAPSREECTANRVQSNTPQQALTLLNDPSFVEAARVLAQNILLNSHDDETRITNIFTRVLARYPRKAEIEALKKMISKQRHYYSGESQEAEKLITAGIAPVDKQIEVGELAAWTQLARVVLNLHEAITRY